MLNTHDIQLRDEEQGHEEGLAAQPPFGWKKVSVLWGFLLVNICFALRAPDRLAWRVWLRFAPATTLDLHCAQSALGRDCQVMCAAFVPAQQPL